MSRLSLFPILIALVAACPFGGAAQAQGMSGHDHSTLAAPSSGSPSSAAYKAAHEKMMRDMGGALTGNADRDFVQGMIPHHQGAIDMARVQLRHGTTAEMRKLAEDIIAAQEAEIAQLRAFLARTASPAPAAR